MVLAPAESFLLCEGDDDAVAAAGNRFSVRWNLMKVIGEYAPHNGHADIIRQRIAGATGE